MNTAAACLTQASPRICTARRVAAFERDDVIARLFAGRDVHGCRHIVEQLLPPSAETCFDVCTDGRELVVSVLYWEAGEYFGTGLQHADACGAGNHVVEVLVSPYGDGLGFLQFGAGPEDDTWFAHHWPYRDDRPSLVARPEFEVDYYFEHMKADLAWIVFFRFPLPGIVGKEYTGPLGFNVMRTQLRHQESASWNPCFGNGFCDASSAGWLRLEADMPAPTEAPWCRTEPVPGLQLQGTYDWPDEMVGGPYTPEVLRHELQYLRDHGMGRVYWIDYPSRYTAAVCGERWPNRQIRHFQQTIEAFGGDPYFTAVELAHEVGLEFFSTFKPYDLIPEDHFAREHPELWLRRNPAWTVETPDESVTCLTLHADNAKPLTFDPEGIRLFASDDNVTFREVEGWRTYEEVVRRPRFRWTPAGKQPIPGATELVRRITLTGACLEGGFGALQFPAAAAPGDFGNQIFLLMEAGVPVTLAFRRRGADFREGGFDFERDAAAAGWSDRSEGILHRMACPAGQVIGFKLGQFPTHTGMLDPTFPEARQWWLDTWVQRAIDAGADGVDVRIAHHHVCNDWLAYAFAEPVLEAFRERLGRDPEATPQDYEIVRRIRGEAHTQFLRDAKALLLAAGRKLEAHVEARMKTPPEHDTFTQIHWDYATWIDEGIVDGVNLKYLGPLNPWVHREILPRARRAGIPLHVISAIGDPRSQPRTPEWAVEQLRHVAAAGLNGLNLYELWVYLRTTPRGEWFRRGCAGAIFDRLHTTVQELTR